jgi:hypothetical protein
MLIREKKLLRVGKKRRRWWQASMRCKRSQPSCPCTSDMPDCSYDGRRRRWWTRAERRADGGRLRRRSLWTASTRGTDRRRNSDSSLIAVVVACDDRPPWRFSCLRLLIWSALRPRLCSPAVPTRSRGFRAPAPSPQRPQSRAYSSSSTTICAMLVASSPMARKMTSGPRSPG